MNKRLFQLILFPSCVFMAGQLMAAPRFTTVGETKHDWGEVVQGDMVDYSFRFKNTGDDTLIIFNVRSSCGCTAALASNDHVAPGQSGEIKVSFNSEGRSNKQRKSISVATNDPDTPNFTFLLEGNVIVPIEISPAYLTFSAVSTGNESSSEVTLTNRTSKTLELGTPQSPNKELQIVIEKRDLKPGEATKITAVFKPVETKGRLTGTVVIPFVGEDTKSVKIRVWGRVNQS